MKMSKREQVMVILLLIAAILAGSYYLVITPQMEKLDALEADQEDMRIQVDTTAAQIASIARLRKGVEDMLVTIDEETKTYFPSILTEKILIVLNDLFIQNGVVISEATFSPPGEVQGSASRGSGTNANQGSLSLTEIRSKLEALEAEPDLTPTPTPSPIVPIDPAQIQNSLKSLTGMNVSLSYSAPYESLGGFIIGLEKMERSLAVTSLTTYQNEDGTVSGDIELAFYALPKITGQEDPYIEWPYTGDYGKPNPFAAPGYDVTVNVAAFTAGANNLSLSVPAIAPSALLSVEQGGVTEVELLLAPAAGGYASSFRIGTTVYPTTGAINVLTTDQSIRVLVTSTPRVDDLDLSGITLIVRNSTILPVLVTVIGDDAVNPRVEMGAFEGIVTVR